MAGLGNGHQAVVSSFKVRGVEGNRVHVEGKACVYYDDIAEQARVGITVDTVSKQATLGRIQSDEHLLFGNVLIDKKRLLLQHIVAGGMVHVVKLDKHIDKINIHELVGSVDTDNDTVVIVANRVPPTDDSRYKYNDGLGEQLEQFKDPRLFIVADMKITFIDTGTLTPLKAILCGGKVYFTAIDNTEPRTNGILYCSNKPVGLYCYNMNTIEEIIKDGNVRSLIANKDRDKLVFLQSTLGGAHFKPCQVRLLDCHTGAIKTLAGNVQVGSVFGMCLPEQQFDNYLYFTTQTGFYSQCVRLDTTTGELTVLSPELQSWSVVAVTGSGVVAQWSTMSMAPCLYVIDTSVGVGIGQCHLVYGTCKNDINTTTELIRIHEDCEALLIQPTSNTKRCVLMPHGGPNSNYVDEYAPLISLLLANNIAVCRVNYTGSTGYTTDSLRRLIDHHQVGVVDVSDCKAVADRLLHAFPVLSYYGGSHGGYLGAVLTAKFPSLFDRAVLVNPVIAMWANAVASDINDYVWHNLGLEYDHQCPSMEELAMMWSRSPKPDKIQTKTLIVVGGRDKRVPARCNGVAWWGWLRRAGAPVECLWFEGGDHGLSGEAEMERDVRAAVLRFLL